MSGSLVSQAANCPSEIPERFHTPWPHTAKEVENLA